MVVPVSRLPPAFQLDIPEIYQIEVSSACNFDCTICPRKLFPRKDKTKFIDPSLIDKLIEEDAFRGSYFVELQMSGEPTLHPNLGQILSKLKSAGVATGLSTNGHDLSLTELHRADYVTVSVDTLDNTVRHGREDPENFIWQLKRFIWRAEGLGKPSIDLQLVEIPGWERELDRVIEVFKDELLGSNICDIRTVPDCFLTKFDEPSELPVSREICLNPWLSVSIQSNGNVTACCFSFGDDIILGNIYEQRLEDIWNSVEVEKLREEHATGEYRGLCARCYMRSPALLHWNIFNSSIRK